MLNTKFAEYVAQLPLLTERLRVSDPLTSDEIRRTPHPGVYCFSENGRILYIGRTRNFSKRHKNHCGATSGENTAAFAFLLAREATGNRRASYKAQGSRKDLMRDELFAEQFAEAKSRIRKMEVRFIPIDDHNLQHLFELYAHMQLQSAYNRFETT